MSASRKFMVFDKRTKELWCCCATERDAIDEAFEMNIENYNNDKPARYVAEYLGIARCMGVDI